METKRAMYDEEEDKPLTTQQLAVHVRNTLIPMLHNVALEVYCPDAHKRIEDVCTMLFHIYMQEVPDEIATLRNQLRDGQ
jgi:hypothetical protein